MRAIIQRVTEASVHISGNVHASIGHGLLILLGVEEGDTRADAEWLSAKIYQMRIFEDAQGLMNISLADTGGEMLVISQFTLFASTKKGNRPSFIRSARPEMAIHLYAYFIDRLNSLSGKQTATGEFGAEMQVHLVNNGPVTIIIDSKNKE
ncbi:MAG: D-aminoacyl-tRNA deacylase [Chitinophagales bacterium]